MTRKERDLELVERAREGDRDAYARLAEPHRPRLLALVRSRLGAALLARLDPEDIVQEVHLKALRSIEAFRWQGEGSFFRWLGGIAENTILDCAERERRRGQLCLRRDVHAGDGSPSRALRREERLERLEKQLAGLSAEHREVILLARIEGLPLKEIARRQGRSPNAVAQLLWRALQKLKASFGDTESFHLPERRLGEGGRREE